MQKKWSEEEVHLYYIGIDLGGTNIAVGLVDFAGKILSTASTPTGMNRNYQQIAEDMATLVHKIVANQNLSFEEIVSVGIGSPGVMNHEKGMVVYSCNLNFFNAPLIDEFKKHINLPVYLENDANCAALAESFCGAAKGSRHSITITLGTGVGGGIVIDKKIYSGFNYAAGELGHMVLKVDGKLCGCGRKGCWEAYSSATALIQQTKDTLKISKESFIRELVDNDMEKIEAKTVFDAADADDAVAIEIVKEYMHFLSEGIANVINIFQPEVLVIGGGISKRGEKLLTPLREAVASKIYSKEGMAQTTIKLALSGNDAGIIGAAMLAVQQKNGYDG